MSIPKAVFLDTQVFDSANYNFSSTAITSFIKLCRDKGLVMLLPAPTRSEIRRHMFERAQAAEEALNKALSEVHKKASFLSSWERYPAAPKQRYSNYALRIQCQNAWASFCKNIKVEELKYEGIQLSTIMHWYDLNLAPFGKGKKQKEFPDAIALAILSAHGKKHDIHVAVVSDDGDMRAGCDRFQNLLYFPSLSNFLEAWLSEDKNLDLYINVINASLEELNEALTNEIRDFAVFQHYKRQYACEKSSPTEVSVGSFDIIALGNHQCTIAFTGIFEAEHLLSWEDDWPDGSPRKEEGWITQEYQVSGTAKIIFSSDKKNIESCDNLVVETHHFEIEQRPRRGSW